MPDWRRRGTRQLVMIAAGAAALSLGGYFLNKKWRCDGLEEDYLNSVSSMTNIMSTRSLVQNNAELSTSLEQLDAREKRRFESIVSALLDECGPRSVDTAHRKASTQLLGR